MDIVAPAVAEAVRADEVRAAGFVAGCAERMAQLFTGSRGPDEARGADLDLFVRAMDALWTDDTTAADFGAFGDAVERLPELASDDDDPPVDSSDIAATLAVIALVHATRYRATGDAEEALACGHVCLTAMALIDQNTPASHLREDEDGYQSRDIEPEETDPARRRAAAREISRARLAVVFSSARE
ncbi:hypothetical protein ACFVJ5_18540 [Nocardia sp. NPDC127606]|uniref:hypothetical protein n=1 Tax=Nocardia sp. NPDC127606 TaxID=3345406 RepID=UPI00363F640E